MAMEEFKLLLQTASAPESKETKAGDDMFEGIQKIVGDRKIGEKENEALFQKFDEYAERQKDSFLLFNLLPLRVMQTNWDKIRQRLATHPPLVRAGLLIIAATNKLAGFVDEQNFLAQCRTVSDAFQKEREITSLHHFVFWFAKAVLGMNNNDKQQVQHYYAFITISNLPLGQFKKLYVLHLVWFLKDVLVKDLKNES